MFTGLIEAQAIVQALDPTNEGARLTLAVTWPDSGTTQLGDSIAVDGCCLTAIAVQPAEILAFDLSHETLARTAFGKRQPGDRCNVERALRLGDRLGGHLVTGHVDGTATLVAIESRGDCWDLTYALPPDLEAEIVTKGSVAIDGVSLTVNATPPGQLAVTIIPHTAAQTQLLQGGAGKRVHIETDLLAKHVRRLLQLQARDANGGGVDEALLRRTGFLRP